MSSSRPSTFDIFCAFYFSFFLTMMLTTPLSEVMFIYLCIALSNRLTFWLAECGLTDWLTNWRTSSLTDWHASCSVTDIRFCYCFYLCRLRSKCELWTSMNSSISKEGRRFIMYTSLKVQVNQHVNWPTDFQFSSFPQWTDKEKAEPRKKMTWESNTLKFSNCDK